MPLLATAQRVAPSQNALRVNLLAGDKITATVRAIGNGTNEATCKEDAQQKAIKALLFIGLSSPDIDAAYKPLVTDADQNDPYFTTMFDTQLYKQYITAASPSSPIKKVRGQKKREQAFDIVISRATLENDLRKDKVIKRMGLQ